MRAPELIATNERKPVGGFRRHWHPGRWIVLVAVAGYWSVRPTPLPTDVLYGARDEPPASPSSTPVETPAAVAMDSSDDAEPELVGDSTLLTVDWRMLGMLDYRSTTVPRTVARLQGRRVRIPGFIVPLEDFQEKAKEFLLVPYFGACVHMPPPPPNQMVFVKLVGGPRTLALFDPVWVEGMLEVKRVNSPYGAVSYTMTGQRIVPYREDR
jgi:hypothetical protein